MIPFTVLMRPYRLRVKFQSILTSKAIILYLQTVNVIGLKIRLVVNHIVSTVNQTILKVALTGSH